MIVCKAVLSSVLLLAVLDVVTHVKPHPSIVRERHVIHAPIKFRVIHHYRIKKVPIIIKKHLHYHKQPFGKVKLTPEDIGANHIYQDDSKQYSHHLDFHQQDDSKQYSHHLDFHQQDDSKEFPPHHPDFHEQRDSRGRSPHLEYHQDEEEKGNEYLPHQQEEYDASAAEPQHGLDDSQEEEEDYEDSQQSSEDYDEYE